MNTLKRIFKKIPRNKWTIGGAIILLLLVFVVLKNGGNTLPFETAHAERMDIVQEVSVTGRVKAADKLDLAFERSGRVIRVAARVGDSVALGEVLVVQNQADLLAKREQAEAKVAGEEARLAELRRGTRPEEIEVERVKVDNAKLALADASSNVVTELRDAYTKADDAVRKNVDQMFSNPRSDSPVFSVSGIGSQKSDVEWERQLMESALDEWERSLVRLSSDLKLDENIAEAEAHLLTLRNFLAKVALALGSAQPTPNISQTTLDTWRTAISTARASVDTALGNLRAAEEKHSTAKQTLTLAEEELTLLLAGSVLEQIEIQEAALATAKADVAVVAADIAKTVLRSPIAGVVTVQDANVGEIVAAHAVVVTLISAASYEIEANIPEADIALIELGDGATVTLDAYGDEVVFKAAVVAIDPAETIIEGVSTYGVTLQFDVDDDRVRSGMTADIVVRTDERPDVIAIPSRAVVRRDGVSYVKVVQDENSEPTEVAVETGLRSSDGFIEILNGVAEGDRIVTFER